MQDKTLDMHTGSILKH